MFSSESQRPNNLITNLVKVFQNAAFTSALAFTIFMVVLEEIIFQNPQALYFFGAARQPGYYYYIMDATVFLISLILFFVFIYVSLHTTMTVRLLYFVVFTIAILSQYSYQNTFHRFMSILDLYTAMNTPFGTWLDAAFLFFNWLGFIPMMVYLILLWAVKSESKYGIETFILLLLLIVGINSAFYHTGFGQTSTISVPSYLKTLTNAVWERPVNLSRQTIAFKSKSPQNNIVLIIDESVRGDHLSVNGYHRPTTPYLEQLSEHGYIYNWGPSASAASCSLMSNSVIVTGLSSLPDTENRRFQNPIIFQYAKAMGYKTYHYDAQTNYLWNSTSVSDLKYIDHWIHADIIGKDIDSDFRIADQVSELLKSSVGNFIVINKRGVHFHYNSSYPPDKAVWTPVSPAGKLEDPTRVYNSYDNGVLYNVDNFFRHLIPNPDDIGETSFLYTSDHGETLLDGGVPWLHCGPTKSEATVPLLLISQHDYAVDRDYKASHYNIFATLLDLMQFPESERLHEYPRSLFAAKAADSSDRYFLDGNSNLINYDGQ